MSEIVSVISSVGFPIVACCAMGWFIANKIDKLTAAITENNHIIRDIISGNADGVKDGNMD